MRGFFPLSCLHVVVSAFIISSSAYDTSSWQRFWWWTPQQKWPTAAADILENPYGTCQPTSPYCFQRLPTWAEEDFTELLAIDLNGAVYKWKFDSTNPTAHAVWKALHDHQETSQGQILNNAAWDPATLEGNKPKATQDSFMYRDQNGVKSFLLDDDNCDCLSTLSMGHGMCGSGHSTQYGPANVFGVDELYDPKCQGPKPGHGLTLYFRTIKKLTLDDYGGNWRAFWWWNKNGIWPQHVRDVLRDDRVTCKAYDYYCFHVLPHWLKENETELLAIDSLGTAYKWAFNPNNPVSHAAWLALHGHQESPHKAVLNSSPWNPVVLKGTGPSTPQDSFMYREEHGVKSLLLDDDNCDCLSTLNLGHGMCNAGHSSSYSKPNVYGVDALYDDGCHGPVPTVGLTLYYRTRRPDFHGFGGKWRAFWWWNAGVEWPRCTPDEPEIDVLEHPFGTCFDGDPFCFQRLPSWLEEDSTVILGQDLRGNVYQWNFNFSNPTAHAAWSAFHDHKETAAGAVLNKKAWNPRVLQGHPPPVTQDSFLYATKQCIKSVLLDDDNCDCLSSMNLGGTVCPNQLDPGARGVDALYDPVCNLPSPDNGLILYYRVAENLSFEGYGYVWTAFWWWPKDGRWPNGVTDILEKSYGSCKETDVYCFQRLPSDAEEGRTKLLAIDTDGNVYMWTFTPSNPTAHAAWMAFHDHVETPHKKIVNNNAWNPKLFKGTAPKARQDSFMYREQAGVKSLLLDDDNCDCLSTLNLGHGMCLDGFSTSNGPENRFGVDALYDDHCNTPRPSVGLTLYYSVRPKAVHSMTACSYGENWLAFWWWTGDAIWPADESDVLGYSYGRCTPHDDYCFGRLPSWAEEDSTEMLAIDSKGNDYLWQFDSSNAVAHAAWLAFHDHVTTSAGSVLNQQDGWDPVVLKGSKPTAKQDSFMYRDQNGVKSILMDDDNCDCLTTLNIGHGMCKNGHDASYGPANQFGVDALYDPGCNVPRPEVGLTLYFRPL